MSAWREGKHCQAEAWRVTGWCGIAMDRWMLGVVLNTEERLSLGFGVGPFYFGVGTIG